MNRRKPIVAGLSLLIATLLLCGCGARVQPPKVVARVNGVELTASDLSREMRHTRAFYLAQHGIDLNAPGNEDLLQQARLEALERIIDQELVRQIAEGLLKELPGGGGGTPITISDEEVQALASQYEAQAGSREELLKQNGFESYSEFLDFVRGNLRVQKIAEQYGQAEQVHVRHILVNTLEEARQVMARLQAGEDFAALAKELSIDVASGASGGDLGWFGRGATVGPFEEAAFSLEPGQTSEPVQTQYGFHIIELLEKRMGADPQAFQTWFDQVKATVTVERFELE